MISKGATQKEHLDTQQRYQENVLWTDETEVELFENNAAVLRIVEKWCKMGSDYQNVNISSTMNPVEGTS